MPIVGSPSQTKTLLDGVNEVLKRTQHINAGNEITALTGNAKQNAVDIAIQVLNWISIHLYERAHLPLPKETSENTITITTDIRSYALEEDLIQLYFPLINQTTGDTIDKYVGGYKQLFDDQRIPANYTGKPQLAAISPINGELYLDRIPTSNENGSVYRYMYDRSVVLSNSTDVFPFNDTVMTALVPAAAQLVKRDMQNKFDASLFKSSVGLASRMLTIDHQNDSWLPKVTVLESSTDPYAN